MYVCMMVISKYLVTYIYKTQLDVEDKISGTLVKAVADYMLIFTNQQSL
jgi:hypothetical protein